MSHKKIKALAKLKRIAKNLVKDGELERLRTLHDKVKKGSVKPELSSIRRIK